MREKFLGNSILEVWTNEDAAPAAGDDNSWEHCIRQAEDSEIFVSLFNGNAGWSGPGDFGICHAELEAALRTGRSKVRLVQLPEPTNFAPDLADVRFKEFVAAQSLFRGGSVSTRDELVQRVRDAVTDAVLDLCRRGRTQSKKDRYDRGEALEWSRLSYAARKARIEATILDAIRARNGAEQDNGHDFVRVDTKKVLLSVCAAPAALSVAEARELVGRPHLHDHRVASALANAHRCGPVHVIGCHRGVTESQALAILGLPDAVVVKSGFGIYVADDVQKAQLAFLAGCRDDAATRHMVQLLFDWLEHSGEAVELARRAQSRRTIVRAIAKEQGA